MRTDMCKHVGGSVRLRHCVVLSILIAMTMWGVTVTSAWAQRPVPATLTQAATPMLPFMDWLIDPSGALTVEDMANPAQQAAFRPLHMDKIPPESGTVWLRFSLAPRVVDARPSTYLLDMGEGVPGTPILYIPKHNALDDTTSWQDLTPSQRSIFLMPDAQTSPVTAYIKMSGMPGLWFAPMIRTPHNAATALERLMRPAVIVVLGVVMLLCLLRGLAERGEWRFWTSLYTGAALLYSVWGVPTLAQGAVPMEEIAAVLAPGVALMLLPHVGRHLMRTREKARIIDVQYLLLTLPGAALALIPLIPGFSWTIRYLDLWPLGTLLLVPTTLGAWLMGLAGARRFLLGCLLPPLVTALGLAGIGSSFPAPLLATAPLWGVALSALIIAGTAVTYEPADSEAARRNDDLLHDPALRIVPPEELAQEVNSPQPEPTNWEKNAPYRMPSDSVALAWEEKLRAPMDTLLREGAALGACSLPPVARQHAQSLQETVREMLTLLSQPLEGQSIDEGSATADDRFDLQQLLRDAHDFVATSAENKNIALSWFMPPHLPNRFVGDGQRLALCVRLLLESAVRATSRGGVQLSVRRVPESVDAGHLLFSVTDTGAGMPPHDRSSMAVARAWELAAVYRGFLGVECSPHGTSVSFTVRLPVASSVAAASNDAGVAMPQAMTGAALGFPQGMSPEGDILEPVGGVESAFGASLMDQPVPTNLPPSGTADASAPVPTAQNEIRSAGAPNAAVKAATRPSLPKIIIADDSLSNRQLLAFFLEGLPYTTVEARSPDEAVELFTASPAALIIFDGDMPEDDTLNAVTRIRALETEYALPPALVLALTTDDSRWEVLHYGGFTHALVKPVSRTGLRRTVQELLPEGTEVVPPLPLAFGATASAMGTPDVDGANADMSTNPVPFAIPHTEDILHEQTATKAAWLDEGQDEGQDEGLNAGLGDSSPVMPADDEEIIDTGAPLPDPEPLRMTPEPAAPTRASAGGGMVLPMMDTLPQTPVAMADVPDKKAVQGMPELALISAQDNVTGDTLLPSSAALNAPLNDAVPNAPVAPVAPAIKASATTALVDDVPVTTATAIADDADTDREEMYPHHAGGSVAGGEAATHKVASLDSSAHAVHPAEPAPRGAAVPATASSRIVRTAEQQEAPAPTVKSSTMAEQLEWVGEPMPVGSVPPASGQTRSNVSAIPAWMRDSVAPRAEGASFREQDSAAEWVGEPMPIPKASPASPASEDARTSEAAVPTPAVTPAEIDLADAPARIEDLLQPFSASTFAAEDKQAADDGLALEDAEPASSLSAQENRPSFLPLSFDTPPAPAPAPATAPAPAPASALPVPQPDVPQKEQKAPVTTRVIIGPAAVSDGPRHEEPSVVASPATAPIAENAAPMSEHGGALPKSERMSLIPESSLMDFIISTPPESAAAQAAETAGQAPEQATKQVAPAVSSAPPKTITITANPSHRTAKVATTTAVLKPVVTASKVAPAGTKTEETAPKPAPTISVTAAAKPVSAPVSVPEGAGAAPAATQTAEANRPATPAAPHDSPIPTMLKEFDEAMVYARGGFARKNIEAVHDAAVYIATRSETCGLRVLARMARCVGEAAKAADMEALNNLLPELEIAVERNKIALMKK